MPRASAAALHARIRAAGFWTPIPMLLSATLLVVGLLGTFSYWEAYYQHRGFIAPARLKRAGAGRLLSINFHSDALGRRADYLIYLPAGYTPSRHYPVFYLLHGMPGRPQVYIDIANMDIRLDNRLSEGQVPPMILVFPDGRIGGSTLSDSEWANTKAGQYESYVLEVVHDVDQRFATTPNRQSRVIAGFSAGAYGALNIALHHLGVFGSVEVWSGYFRQTRSGVFSHATPAGLAYNSPLTYVRTLSRQLAALPLRVFMFVGRHDSSSRQIVPMANALAASGARVSYTVYPGGHDWELWYGHLNQMLVLAGQDVLQPLRAGRIVRPRHLEHRAHRVRRRGARHKRHAVERARHHLHRRRGQ